jgi:hypothetical protein
MRQLPLLACAALLVVACGTLEERYQRDVDPVRVAHVDYLASLTTEFLRKTGRLPLADRLQGKTIEVLITHRPLSPSILEQQARSTYVSLSTGDLKADLEKGLGRTINLPSDPQNYPSYGPNFYTYDVNAVRACVAGHLFFQAPGSFLVEVRAPATGMVSRYYKYEHCIPSKAGAPT